MAKTTQRIQRKRQYGKDDSKDTKKKTIWHRRLKGYIGKDNDRWDTDHSSARDDGMFKQATSSSESSGQPEENDIW